MVEGLPESVDLVLAGGEQVEQKMTAPWPVLMVAGEKLFQTIVSAEMVAFWSSSSRRRTEATGWGSYGTRQTWSAGSRRLLDGYVETDILGIVDILK